MKLIGLKVSDVQDLNLGNFCLTLEDGTKVVTSIIIPASAKVADDDDEDEAPAPKKAAPAPAKKAAPVEDDDDEDETPKKAAGKKKPEPEKDELTWEDLKGMDEDELTDYIEEGGLDTDPDDFEDDLPGLRKAIAKEQGIEIPKKK